jgi:hypothetical protein
MAARTIWGTKRSHWMVVSKLAKDGGSVAGADQSGHVSPAWLHFGHAQRAQGQTTCARMQREGQRLLRRVGGRLLSWPVYRGASSSLCLSCLLAKYGEGRFGSKQLTDWFSGSRFEAQRFSRMGSERRQDDGR